jgi:hypothetical protein
LDELLNSTESEEVREVVEAYWTHIKEEVPAPPLSKDVEYVART